MFFSDGCPTPTKRGVKLRNLIKIDTRFSEQRIFLQLFCLSQEYESGGFLSHKDTERPLKSKDILPPYLCASV